MSDRNAQKKAAPSKPSIVSEGLYIGIDLGGTKILAVVLDENGTRLSRHKLKTDPAKGVPGLAAVLKEAATGALTAIGKRWEDVREIGVAVPGPVDPKTGHVANAPNLGWKNAAVREVFETVFARPVYLENDVNCGTLGEYRLGAGRGCRNIVGIFPGTGIGGGILIDGKLVRGVKGVAGELGHVKVKIGGRRCGCGRRGCLEAYCSKVAFGRRFDRLINKKGHQSMLVSLQGNNFSVLKSKVLAKAYRAGDALVKEVIDEGARYLGAATAGVLATLGPDLVIYGGGVMEELGDDLLPVIRQSVYDNLFGLEPEDVRLALSELGGEAVAMGAACLAMSGGEA